MQTITDVNSLINGLVWGWPALILAATVGTGNIVGVAGAIAVGGPGAVFWMWLIAFFGMMTNFSENVLGILYRRKNSEGEWCGGAMYYLRDGLGGKKNCKQLGAVLAVLFSAFCVLASFGIGNMSQVNSMTKNINHAFHIPNLAIGIFIFLAVALVIVGGLKRVAAFTEKLVPFMVVLYLVGTLVIIMMHATQIPAVLVSIFKGAFAMKSAAGGIVGAGIAKAMQMGMKRGVFSNEAGLGSSVMVHSSSNVIEPVKQGMWGIFEVFADTIVVCTLTALTILTSGCVDLSTGQLTAVAEEIGSSSLVSYAFEQSFGKGGSMFIAIAIFLFAYSTVLGWSHYGSKAFEYLFGTKAIMGYRVIFSIVVLPRNMPFNLPPIPSRFCYGSSARLGYFRYLQRPDDDPQPDRCAHPFPYGHEVHAELCGPPHPEAVRRRADPVHVP